MKMIKRLFLAVIVIAAVTAMWGCDGLLGNIIDNAVFPYSENGEQEIELNFAAILSDTYKGINEWTVTIVEGEETDTFNVKYYADKSGETDYQKLVYIKDNSELFTIIIVGKNTYYYIDEVNKTVSQNSTGYTEQLAACISGAAYGIVDLKNNEDEANWTFVAKRDATVNNSSEADEAVVEYEYTSVEQTLSTKSVKLLVDFRKVITPVIARLYYEITIDGELDRTITVYPTLHTAMPEEGTFTVPGVAEGYTVLA